MIKINEAKSDPRWKTIKGTHVKVNKKGQIVDGPDSLKNLNPETNTTSSTKSSNSQSNKSLPDKSSNDGPSALAQLIAKGIEDAGQFVGNNVQKNLSHHN